MFSSQNPRPPSARTLSRRDMAVAAAIGVIGADGAGFGYERNNRPRSSFGGGFGGGRRMGGGFGFGADPAAALAGTDVNAPPNDPSHPLHPQNRAMVMATLAQAQMQREHTDSRAVMMNPNGNSTLKVERYDFSLTQQLTLGTALPNFSVAKQPTVTIRPQRYTTNAPLAMFVLLSQIQTGNVQAIVGDSTDAFTYGSASQGVYLDLPTLQPQNVLTIGGLYSGVQPPIYPIGFVYQFKMTFQGPSTMDPSQVPGI